MLIIKCSGCHAKLWKYEKIGKGNVLICHKSHILKYFKIIEEDKKVYCKCGLQVGIDKDDHIKMIARGFTSTGTKKNQG